MDPGGQVRLRVTKEAGLKAATREASSTAGSCACTCTCLRLHPQSPQVPTDCRWAVGSQSRFATSCARELVGLQVKAVTDREELTAAEHALQVYCTHPPARLLCRVLPTDMPASLQAHAHEERSESTARECSAVVPCTGLANGL